MTIKQQGGVFGRNPTFNDVTSNNVTTEDLYVYHPTTNQIAKFESGDATAQIVVSDNVADVRIKNTAGKMLLEADPNQEGAGSYLRFTVDGSTAAEFTASGNLAFPSGQGIDFSATAGTGTSELFADYEEGTWTPEYAPSSGSFASITMDSSAAVYTKVGRMVTISALIRTDAIDVTGGSGGVLISGLPFPVTYWSAISLGRVQSFAGDMPDSGYAGGNSTSINLYYRATSNGATTALDVTDLQNGTNANVNYIFLEFTYQTT